MRRRYFSPHRRSRNSWPVAFTVLLIFPVVTSLTGRLHAAGTVDELQFDIPAQSLAKALRAYSEMTGVEVFYDGTLAIGRSSSAVKGRLTATRGLDVLLEDSGYVARSTEISNTVTIIPAPSTAALHQSFERFQPYFAMLQDRLSNLLCRMEDAHPASEKVTLRFWLSRSGVVLHTQLLQPRDDDSWRRTYATRASGLDIGMAPPVGLPQPLTMVVYPPLAGEKTDCQR